MPTLDELFQSVKARSEPGKQTLADQLAGQTANDRSNIAQKIINTFVWLIVLFVVAVIAGTYLLSWERISEPAKIIVSMVSSVLLPVVTLVIGYYFGTTKKE